MTRSSATTPALIALVVASALAAPTASAFVCTRTSLEGPSVAWAAREVTLQRSGAGHEIAVRDVDDALARSTRAWTDVACSDFALVVGEPTDDRLVGFDWAAGSGSARNHNILVFRNDELDDPADAWLHTLGAIAITTVTFDTTTGEVFDTDVEMNDSGFDFTVCDPLDPGCDAAFDVDNTLTHELGHVVGLDHTDVSDATMFASAPRGDVEKRTLAADDVDGVCALYPDGAATGECYGVGRPDAPDVRFEATMCASTSRVDVALAVLTLALCFLRPRTRRAPA